MQEKMTKLEASELAIATELLGDTEAKMTPLEYSKGRRNRPAWIEMRKRQNPARPNWRQLAGRMAIIHSYDQVKPAFVFSVRSSGLGGWEIIREWPATRPGRGANTLSDWSIKAKAEAGLLEPYGKPMDYNGMVALIRREYKNRILIPPEWAFWEAFGLYLDDEGHIQNPRGLV